MSWRPIGYKGFSDVNGSWNTAPISRPRTLRIDAYGSLSMRRPDSRISPLAIRPGGSMRPMIAAPVSDLPAPDSPTTPSTSPSAIEKLTSLTATSVPRRVGNSTHNARTSSSGPALRGSPLVEPMRAWSTTRPPWIIMADGIAACRPPVDSRLLARYAPRRSRAHAAARNGFGLVDDGCPLGLDRITELRVDVIAKARTYIECHLLNGPGEATVPRRFDGDRVGSGRNFVRNVEH